MRLPFDIVVIYCVVNDINRMDLYTWQFHLSESDWMSWANIVLAYIFCVHFFAGFVALCCRGILRLFYAVYTRLHSTRYDSVYMYVIMRCRSLLWGVGVTIQRTAACRSAEVVADNYCLLCRTSAVFARCYSDHSCSVLKYGRHFLPQLLRSCRAKSPADQTVDS